MKKINSFTCSDTKCERALLDSADKHDAAITQAEGRYSRAHPGRGDYERIVKE